MVMLDKRDRLGIFIVVVCGMMWGLGGVMGQILFRYSDMSPGLLSSVRILTDSYHTDITATSFVITITT